MSEAMARGGRFENPLDPAAAAFLSSLSVDWRLLADDVDGSIAHVRMLGDKGIIPQEAAKKIESGLGTIRARWDAGTLLPRTEWEDVHMNVEGYLHELIGPDAGFLHTARSRNDQIAVDMHLYMRREGIALSRHLVRLIQSLCSLAERTIDVVMPGYTHMQPAQPIRMGHHWLAYAAMFHRDFGRLSDWQRRANDSPLGAGALAGTPYGTDPLQTAHALGFEKLYENSLDAVSDRDYLVEFLSWASLVMMHVSRICEELVLWSSPHWGFVALADSYSTGSSIMPQKRNPDAAELLRGKAGRVYGDLMSLLTVMKGLPLAYNTDMQEDKTSVFDAVDTVSQALPLLASMLDTLTIAEDRLQSAAAANFINATDLADQLAQTGVPFRHAHHVVGTLVLKALEAGYEQFDAIPAHLAAHWAPEIPSTWLKTLGPASLADARKQPFATARSSVMAQLAAWRSWLEKSGAADRPAGP